MTLLLVIFLTLAASAHAQARPRGSLVDAIAVEGDERLACSFYLNRGKIETFLSRTDSKRYLGAPYWTLRSTRQRLKELAEEIAALPGSKDKNASKKLKKAKREKKSLAQAKKFLEACSREDPEGDDTPKITFNHVKTLLQDKCVNCHGPLGWSNEEDFYVDSGRVTPGNLEASPLYTFLTNNPEGFLPAYMPKGTAPLSKFNIILLSRWIRDLGRAAPPTPPAGATPTPGGEEGEGRVLYQQACASCHSGIDVSSKWGRSAAQIRAAISAGGPPQMRHIRLTDEQLRKIALALSRVQPPLEGTVSVTSLGAEPEGAFGEIKKLRFAITLNGTASQPFTVGFVTSNGTALADSDYDFNSGTVAFNGTNGESVVVEVDVLGDTFEESNESVYLDIGGVSYGGIRLGVSSAEGIILNDDTFVEVLPPGADKLRMALGFNGDFRDAVSLLDAAPQGDAALTPNARVGSGALELDAGADYLTVPGQNLSNLTDFTLATWVFWDNPTAISTRLFDFGSSTSNYIYFSPRNGANRCQLELRTPAGIFILQCITNTVLPSNAWAHLAVTVNTTTDQMKVFFNGTEVASSSGVTAVLSALSLTDNRVGKSRVAGPDFSGRIDELLVLDKALSSQEIAAVIAMTESTHISSSIELRSGNEIIPNGGLIDFGDIEIGEESNRSIFVTNRGTANLALQGAPVVRIAGEHESEFTVEHQVWPWQELLSNGAFAVFSLKYEPTAPGSKQATLIVENSDLRNGNYASALLARGTGEPLSEPTDPSEDDSELAQGQFLYAVNCSSCHGTLANSRKRDTTTQALQAALNPATGVTQMRGLGLTPEQISLVVLALNSPPPDDGETITVENSIVNIGTATYVASVFSEVFLPNDPTSYTGEDNLIKSKITENILGLRSNNTFIPGRIRNFGGRCDRFEDLCQAEAQAAPQRPAPSTIRTGIIIRTCDDILSVNRAVDTITSKIGKTSTSALDAQGTKDLYNLFFPGRELPQYLADVISNYSRGLSGLTPQDHWRFQAHLFCASGDWEAL
jgi:mono/diheme cytochrome c family protein